MCKLSEEIVSCQIQFLTLGSNDISKDVNNILEMIKNSNLTYDVGNMTTLVTGPYKEIFLLLEKITKISIENKSKFVINTIISNECGC